MAKRIRLPGESEVYRIIDVAGDIQIWRRSSVYGTTWLTNRRDKIQDTMTLLENTSVPDYVIIVIGEIAAEFRMNEGRDLTLSYKDNLIKVMKKERDTINWILSLGTSISSSSSYSSSSCSSSSCSSSSSSYSFSLSSTS